MRFRKFNKAPIREQNAFGTALQDFCEESHASPVSRI
jgi:hypothetical protein